ncbi:MAG: Asp-tRNA(Asn)/Glu-tRNA(Gln) amidotransferase subunit GatC, partial [Candidatus Terrybacteria bacterium]|nr:Asp-tRNA(Asn)/Glu-tRNA(Gln) amidotransferase subunit GatC [Candidatus Terrybacteria bacterium]
MEQKDIVHHIAQLVHISFTDAEIEKFSREFRAILDFVGKLKEVDVEGVEPIAHITGRENARREDAFAADGGAVLP